MKNGVICLGEALIDFIPTDKTNQIYHKSPGGAPANVAVGLARLGTESAFLGKVGDDSLGRFLKETLLSFGADCSHMILTNEAPTGLAMVEQQENGERTFEFHVNPSADTLLDTKDIAPDIFEHKEILHIGSISLIHEPVKFATWKAIQLAQENGMLLSYDPNLRLSLWENAEVAKEIILSVMPFADIVKLSEDELEFLAGGASEQHMIEFAKQHEIAILFITKGEQGCIGYCHSGIVHVPAISVKAVDTTGAGDAFVSSMLHKLHQYQGELSSITKEELEEIAVFANTSGGMTASVKGAMSALPTEAEISEYVEQLLKND